MPPAYREPAPGAARVAIVNAPPTEDSTAWLVCRALRALVRPESLRVFAPDEATGGPDDVRFEMGLSESDARAFGLMGRLDAVVRVQRDSLPGGGVRLTADLLVPPWRGRAAPVALGAGEGRTWAAAAAALAERLARAPALRVRRVTRVTKDQAG
ncbi:MAG: hypothetical protein ACJ8AO_02755 [Gemmatimonadaceae bacterium]